MEISLRSGSLWKLSSARDGNWLECINLVATRTNCLNLDQDLTLTGTGVVIVSGADGSLIAKCPKLLELTKKRLLFTSVCPDIVFLRPAPLHKVPLVFYPSRSGSHYSSVDIINGRGQCDRACWFVGHFVYGTCASTNLVCSDNGSRKCTVMAPSMTQLYQMKTRSGVSLNLSRDYSSSPSSSVTTVISGDVRSYLHSPAVRSSIGLRNPVEAMYMHSSSSGSDRSASDLWAVASQSEQIFNPFHVKSIMDEILQGDRRMMEMQHRRWGYVLSSERLDSVYWPSILYPACLPLVANFSMEGYRQQRLIQSLLSSEKMPNRGGVPAAKRMLNVLATWNVRAGDVELCNGLKMELCGARLSAGMQFVPTKVDSKWLDIKSLSHFWSLERVHTIKAMKDTNSLSVELSFLPTLVLPTSVNKNTFTGLAPSLIADELTRFINPNSNVTGLLVPPDNAGAWTFQTSSSGGSAETRLKTRDWRTRPVSYSYFVKNESLLMAEELYLKKRGRRETSNTKGKRGVNRFPWTFVYTKFDDPAVPGLEKLDSVVAGKIFPASTSVFNKHFPSSVDIRMLPDRDSIPDNSLHSIHFVLIPGLVRSQCGWIPVGESFEVGSDCFVYEETDRSGFETEQLNTPILWSETSPAGESYLCAMSRRECIESGQWTRLAEIFDDFLGGQTSFANLDRKNYQAEFKSSRIFAYKTRSMQIFQNKGEWFILHHDASFVDPRLFRFSIEWICCSSLFIGDLVRRMSQASQESGFSMIKLPMNPINSAISRSPDSHTRTCWGDFIAVEIRKHKSCSTRIADCSSKGIPPDFRYQPQRPQPFHHPIVIPMPPRKSASRPLVVRKRENGRFEIKYSRPVLSGYYPNLNGDLGLRLAAVEYGNWPLVLLRLLMRPHRNQLLLLGGFHKKGKMAGPITMDKAWILTDRYGTVFVCITR